jgi:polar amino acid transport system substrate-binding protein
MKKIIYVLSLILFCLTTNANATGPRVTSSLFEKPENEIFALDFPLVLSSETAEGGIAAEIIKAAFKNENVENTITPLPLQSMLFYYLNEENALAIVGHDLNLNATETKNFILIPILNLKESYFYYRPKHETLTWTGNLAVFKGLKLGVHKNDKSELYQKFDIYIEQTLLDARIQELISGKIDLIRESNLTMESALKNRFSEQQKNIIRLEPQAGNAIIFIAFNKKNPKGATLAKSFQKGLAKLIATHEYSGILKKYTGDSTIETYFNLISP